MSVISTEYLHILDSIRCRVRGVEVWRCRGIASHWARGDAVGRRLEIEVEICGGGEFDNAIAANCDAAGGVKHGWMVGTPDVAEVGEVAFLRLGKTMAVVLV